MIPDRLNQCLQHTRRPVVLTGAGSSAESGVPTFRDAQTGLWAQYNPADLATPEAFENDPATVWDWYQWRRKLILEARPNAGHAALARWQQARTELALITQNVDGLHQRAGNTGVLELHGNIHRNICHRTGEPIEDAWIARHVEQRPPPSPHHPDGLARPDVVWFGEALPARVLEQAFEAAQQCDLMIVAGTAGAVQPAASLPAVAAEAGATVVEVNPGETELSGLADYCLRGGFGEVLPALAPG